MQPCARWNSGAAARTPADNYDEVLPTGEVAPVAETPFDFRTGKALGDIYLDDCFTELRRDGGRVVAEIEDPAAGYGLRISTPTAAVKAIQVYAPPDKAFVVLEPQFNLADPYSSIWPQGLDTGMVELAPGQSVEYRVRLELFAPPLT